VTTLSAKSALMDCSSSTRNRTLIACCYFILTSRSSAAVAAAVQQLGPRAAHDTCFTTSTAVTLTTSTTTTAATAGTDGAPAAALSKRKRKPSAKAQAAAAAADAAATAAEQQVQAVHNALQRAQEQLARATVYNVSTSDSTGSSEVQGEVSLQEYTSAAAETQALVDRVRELVQPTASSTAAVLPGM
jgi:hypothetical protein